jgi:K+-transporting ATPase ATPase C chain
MKKIIFTAGVMMLIFTFLCGIIYPAIVSVAAKLFFPAQADGSLMRRGGAVIGSALIAQKFEKPVYFHPRPSAVDYNASGSGGSNLAATNPELAADYIKKYRGLSVTAVENAVPEEMLSSSASGLDPDITLSAAKWQVSRVAAARRLDEQIVNGAVLKFTKRALLGFIGPDRVNVLELNVYLDSIKIK